MTFRSRVSSRLEQPIGFENGAYENSAQKVYNRLRFELLGTIKGGWLLEKDSGESESAGDYGSEGKVKRLFVRNTIGFWNSYPSNQHQHSES